MVVAAAACAGWVGWGGVAVMSEPGAGGETGAGGVAEVVASTDCLVMASVAGALWPPP